MSYFRELPNLQYPSFLSDKNSSLEYIDVKNFFRRVKLREDIQNTLLFLISMKYLWDFDQIMLQKNFMVRHR